MTNQTKEKSPDMSVSELLREQARLLAKVADYLAEKSAQTAEGEPDEKFRVTVGDIAFPFPAVINLTMDDLREMAADMEKAQKKRDGIKVEYEGHPVNIDKIAELRAKAKLNL